LARKFGITGCSGEIVGEGPGRLPEKDLPHVRSRIMGGEWAGECGTGRKPQGGDDESDKRLKGRTRRSPGRWVQAEDKTNHALLTGETPPRKKGPLHPS